MKWERKYALIDYEIGINKIKIDYSIPTATFPTNDKNKPWTKIYLQIVFAV